MKKNKDRVWYVILQKWEEYETGFEFPATRKRPVYSWLFGYTKQWARDQARAAQHQGFIVVDICQGTKARINHKFTGL